MSNHNINTTEMGLIMDYPLDNVKEQQTVKVLPAGGTSYMNRAQAI
jgi:hypothetical protein